MGGVVCLARCGADVIPSFRGDQPQLGLRTLFVHSAYTS